MFYIIHIIIISLNQSNVLNLPSSKQCFYDQEYPIHNPYNVSALIPNSTIVTRFIY
jgi:hypothetical protein